MRRARKYCGHKQGLDLETVLGRTDHSVQPRAAMISPTLNVKNMHWPPPILLGLLRLHLHLHLKVQIPSAADMEDDV